jgi:hypothetical protein
MSCIVPLESFRVSSSFLRVNGRAEFACDKGVYGAEAGGKLSRGQPSFTTEPLEKVRSGAAPFQ